MIGEINMDLIDTPEDATIINSEFLIKNKKAIIFDLDGVLFHSSSAHETAFSQTFAEFELPPINYHEISGMRTDEAFKSCLTRNDTPFTELLISQLTIRKLELAHKILSNHPVFCFSRSWKNINMR